MAQVDVLIVAGQGPARRATVACALAGLLTCLLAGGGCLLQPREAEPPQTGDIVVYLEQIDPANTWDNLQTSAGAMHAPGWEAGISSVNFLYIPDSAAEAQFPGVFDNWGREREIRFINALYNAEVTIEDAVMRNPGFVVPPSSGSVSVWENVIYDLKVKSKVDGRTLRYRGSAIITFTLEGNFWYISEWRDQQGESDPDTEQLLPTLGVLRGSFASK
ncbi:MAG: hypothetical protein IPK64_06345 [bacterium]|nr:hypothetical protein [bacterium]